MRDGRRSFLLPKIAPNRDRPLEPVEAICRCSNCTLHPQDASRWQFAAEPLIEDSIHGPTSGMRPSILNRVFVRSQVPLQAKSSQVESSHAAAQNRLLFCRDALVCTPGPFLLSISYDYRRSTRTVMAKCIPPPSARRPIHTTFHRCD